MKHYLMLICILIVLSGCATGFHIEKDQKTTNITINAQLNTPIKRRLEFRMYEYDENKCKLASANHVTRISTHGVFGVGAENNVSLPVPTNEPIYVYYKMVTNSIKYGSLEICKSVVGFKLRDDTDYKINFIMNLTEEGSTCEVVLTNADKSNKPIKMLPEPQQCINPKGSYKT